jgi:hypothetical protein
MVISTYRVETKSPPDADRLLSSSTSILSIEPFSKGDVAEYLGFCFHNQIADSESIEGYLYHQTLGSPLYLRSLLSTMVRLREAAPLKASLLNHSDTVGEISSRDIRLRNTALVV